MSCLAENAPHRSYSQDAFPRHAEALPEDGGNATLTLTPANWSGGAEGRRHNTKEYEADPGMYYMYQRWYLPEVGVFGSQAPYPTMMEPQYSFALQNPALKIDPSGEIVPAIIYYGTGFHEVTMDVADLADWFADKLWSACDSS